MKINKVVTLSIILVSALSACKVPTIAERKENKNVPQYYAENSDSINMAKVNWREYFNDSYLSALIDTALSRNQELNITLQEIEVMRQEISAKQGEYLPFVTGSGGIGVDKVGRYTSQGANDANTDILPGQRVPDNLGDFKFQANFRWEIDIWHKLHNAKNSAVKRYLASVEGKNFMVTNLVSEIASAYYELLGLDNQIFYIQQNLSIQQDALRLVRLQKINSRVTELAVKKFEAEVFHNQSRLYFYKQNVVEVENKINFLIGRFPQHILRNENPILDIPVKSLMTGIPSQLLQNRPDIRQSELNLEASRLDIRVARAKFYPTVELTAGLGFDAFNPKFLLRTPESLLYSLAGDLVAPLVNRKAIKAEFNSATAKQIQAVYMYEQTILTAFTEVVNQISNYKNLDSSYMLQTKEVAALNESINIAGKLFQNARADYMEVLMTQRDALTSRLELVETKKDHLISTVNIYRALGGGWQ